QKISIQSAQKGSDNTVSLGGKSIMTAQAHARADQKAGSREFLVFSLGEEEYAIDILKVKEIRGYNNVTRIANAPEFIKGVTNLRGVIVPIIDMRIKFSVSEAVYDS